MEHAARRSIVVCDLLDNTMSRAVRACYIHPSLVRKARENNFRIQVLIIESRVTK